MSNSIMIPFKSMEIEAKAQKIGEATFYQVTNSWKLVSSRDTQKPSTFLFNDDTRKFMLKAYLNSAVTDGNSRLSKLDGFDVSTNEGLDAYLSHTHKQRLPKEIESHFVYSPDNTKLGTFFEKNLYVKYAMYLDKDFEFAVISLFNKMHEFSQLPASEQVDILTDTIIAIDEAKIKARELTFDEATQVALDKLPSEKMRALGKLGTKELTDILKKFDLDNKYALCHDTIYRNLFGHRASEIKALVEETGSVAARNFLTRYAYRPIVALEQRLTNKLEFMYKKGTRSFTYNELNDMVAKFAKEMSVDLSDPEVEIDFLIKANKEKMIEVTLDTDFKTTKKETVIVSNQLSFFDKL